MFDHRQVMRDEQVREARTLLQIEQQIDDSSLDGDVEGGDRSSSARIFGFSASARAIPMRWGFCPPENSAGGSDRRRNAAVRPTPAVQRLLRRCRVCRNHWPAGFCWQIEHRRRGSRDATGSWNTTWRFRLSARRRGPSSVATSLPSTSMEPDCGALSSSYFVQVVDFPDPDSPTIPASAPAPVRS